MLPDDTEIGWRAEELYCALTLVEEAQPAQREPLVLADLVAFLSEGKPLSHEQQRFLFSSARLRAEFQCLKHDFAVKLDAQPSEGAGAVEDPARRGGRRPVEVRAQIAAASTDAGDFLRHFDGGTLRICPSGVDDQVYIVITLEVPGLAPSALLIESQTRGAIRQMALPGRDADGEIVLIKDLADQTDASLVELLRDPTAVGVFLG
jgi:hypothetical protein